MLLVIIVVEVTIVFGFFIFFYFINFRVFVSRKSVGMFNSFGRGDLVLC